MARVIEIAFDKISIGLDDGTIREIRPTDINFTPNIGDDVDIFESNGRLIVSQKVPQFNPNQNMNPNGGININVNNENNNNNAPPQFQPYYASGKVVNKAIYLVLCFFLGAIGGHKFYAGKVFAGIMYIVFCWTYIPSIIAFFEFFSACFKRSDVHGNIIV